MLMCRVVSVDVDVQGGKYRVLDKDGIVDWERRTSWWWQRQCQWVVALQACMAAQASDRDAQHRTEVMVSSSCRRVGKCMLARQLADTQDLPPGSTALGALALTVHGCSDPHM
jgi:hypothetical protein